MPFESKLTRRAVLVAPSGSLLVANAPTQNDSATSLCEHWLSMNAEADRLSERWSKLETELARNHGWFTLTERQRCRLPAGQELFDIDERLAVLQEQSNALMERLPTLQARSRSGLMAKLAVAAIAITPYDHEEEHNLIASILRDLQLMPIGTV